MVERNEYPSSIEGSAEARFTSIGQPETAPEQNPGVEHVFKQLDEAYQDDPNLRALNYVALFAYGSRAVLNFYSTNNESLSNYKAWDTPLSSIHQAQLKNVLIAGQKLERSEDNPDPVDRAIYDGMYLAYRQRIWQRQGRSISPDMYLSDLNKALELQSRIINGRQPISSDERSELMVHNSTAKLTAERIFIETIGPIIEADLHLPVGYLHSELINFIDQNYWLYGSDLATGKMRTQVRLSNEDTVAWIAREYDFQLQQIELDRLISADE
jgi:hypothetical protein